MSNFLFIFTLLFLGTFVYWYSKRNMKKHENKFDDFAYKMQKDFLENSPSLAKGLNYYKIVQEFYEEKGYTLRKNTDYPTDFIATKTDEILLIRVQGPENKKAITAEVLQNFIGQTVLKVIDDKNHVISWAYVCSKMMCERSAKIMTNAYETRLKFELIKAEAQEQEPKI